MADVCERTHNRLRRHGQRGVHRLDSQRGKHFYTTGCGLRVPKDDAVRTAADVNCQHFGCKPRQDAEVAT